MLEDVTIIRFGDVKRQKCWRVSETKQSTDSFCTGPDCVHDRGAGILHARNSRVLQTSIHWHSSDVPVTLLLGSTTRVGRERLISGLQPSCELAGGKQEVPSCHQMANSA